MLYNVLKPSALALFKTDAQTLTMMWQTVVLGMMMVFIVLAVLWCVLSIFKLVFVGKTSKEAKPTKPNTEKPAPKQSAVSQAPAVAKQDDGTLIAVITAAVAAYMAENGEEVPTGGFRVVSFTRVRGGKPWNSK